MTAVEVRTCPTTGLRLVPASGQTVWRVQKGSYGSLNPPPRINGEDRTGWSRWDLPDVPTIYAATTKKTAFLESLAWAKTGTAMATKTSSLFDADGLPDGSQLDEPLGEIVRKEWLRSGKMPPHAIPAQWRLDRRLYELRLPTYGWFVDISHSDTLAYINRKLEPSRYETQRSGRIIAGDLFGMNRDLTTTLAEILYADTLQDGSQLHGIVYRSTYGTEGCCWAVWLRRVADGADIDSEPTTQIGQLAIESNTPEYREAATALGLTPW